MVRRAHDELEHGRHVARIAVVRGNGERPLLQEVAKEEAECEADLRAQLEELEEHVCLCLITINRTRRMGSNCRYDDIPQGVKRMVYSGQELPEQLSCLSVSECVRLQMIESEAPNISTLHFSGNRVALSLKESLQVKHITLSKHCAVFYACAKLPSVVPNLETFSISSFYEAVNTLTPPSTFLCLKYLSITLYGAAFSRAYDCFSMVSFLDAAPLLETFVIGVSQLRMQHDSIFGDPSPLRQIAGHHHNHLKSVKITGFCSAKSLVELTCYIMENATSLECLTLDTTLGLPRTAKLKIQKFGLRHPNAEL
ncbi:hypothetical protein PR202_gb28485 [Eleusine coracana subsp. coracana]|uniref:At1g61320/AtMIF1 LRR domain-containing protein n=1 Tax=Eleusine coracana subsp. coracana TaxID=191504 RepID=A0AAV5FXL6_ELECO|nr:hypothetical protein PR202_gb28485 [Eleusine coracana subsp. coracana]